MSAVTRRLLMIVAIGLALSACGSAGGEAVAVGSDSISRDELVGYSRALNVMTGQAGPGFTDSIAPGDSIRFGAEAWIFFSSTTQFLENTDMFVATAAERDAAEAFLQQIRSTSEDEFVRDFSPESPGYEDVVDFLVINDLGNGDRAVLVQGAELATGRRDLLDNVQVESRIGVWDPLSEMINLPGSSG